MFQVRTKKFKANPLLGRKQFVVDVVHPGKANVSKAEVADKLKQMYKVSDSKLVSVFGFHTVFGGGRSTGFGLVYENLDAVKQFEPAYRLKRVGIEAKKSRRVRQPMPRRQYKKMLTAVKKQRGKEKTKILKNPPPV